MMNGTPSEELLSWRLHEQCLWGARCLSGAPRTTDHMVHRLVWTLHV